jgi:hypothetical protein
MLNKDGLLAKILATTNAPRSLLIKYVTLVVNEAKDLKQNELLSKSGMNEFRNPATSDEKIASEIHHALISQQKVNWEDDPELAHIEAVAGELMGKTDDPTLWQELFDRVEKLEQQK